MLSIEDQDVLGIRAESKPQQPSSVSQVLKAMSAEPLTWNMPARDTGAPEFRVRVGAGRSVRERAYRLAYRVYEKKGYVPADENGLIVANYDARPETLTVLVEDRAGNDAGTVSLVFDGPAGLPCDEIFGTELAQLRSQGRRLLEVTRLAISEKHGSSKPLLTLLCNVPYAYGLRAGGCTDLLIEVNPRHVAYYVRLLKFEVLGQERPCPRVQGAPAVLLRADLGTYLSEMRRIGGMGAKCTERSLFPHFIVGAQEWEFACFLACHQRPMTASDARYFGLGDEAQRLHAVA